MNNDLQVYPISGVDPSLVGCTIGGWEVKSVCTTSDGDSPISENLIFKVLYRGFVQTNLSNAYLFEYCGDINAPRFIYLFKQVQNIFEIRPIITAFRLFKLSKIGMAYPLSFNQAGGCIGNTIYDYHNQNYIKEVPLFSLSEGEQEKFNEFLEIVSKLQTDHIKQMIQLFHEAYRNHNHCIAFIMRVTVLEMLIDGHDALSYRLSRNTAVLLGRTREESQEIYDNCKKIYSARSTFLHDGKTDKITSEFQLLALDYSRRVIANLICVGKDIKEVRQTLEVCGFGENPYQVQF